MYGDKAYPSFCRFFICPRRPVGDETTGHIFYLFSMISEPTRKHTHTNTFTLILANKLYRKCTYISLETVYNVYSSDLTSFVWCIIINVTHNIRVCVYLRIITPTNGWRTFLYFLFSIFVLISSILFGAFCTESVVSVLCA